MVIKWRNNGIRAIYANDSEWNLLKEISMKRKQKISRLLIESALSQEYGRK